MPKRALIVGLGIAGMSAAIALESVGWVPVIVERAPARRKGGYFIGLREEGKAAAHDLGILDIMEKRTPGTIRFWDVRKDGRRRQIADLTRETDAPIAVLRGDIEDALWRGMGGRIEVRFGTFPLTIATLDDVAHVRLRSEDNRETDEAFDLVIGADGVRSTVRQLVFGPDHAFFRSLKTALCAFPLSRHVEGFSAGDGLMLADKRRTLTVFPLEGRPSTALFSYRTRQAPARERAAPVDTLRRVFAGLDVGGIVSHCLDDLAQTDDFLFDSVQMVRMPKWAKDRVVLVGDAAWCLTLYSGMGASAAMMGGLALGDALAAHSDDVGLALKSFEAAMRPFVRRHQRFVALRSQLFVPSTRLSLWGRRALWQVTRWSRTRASRSATGVG